MEPNCLFIFIFIFNHFILPMIIGPYLKQSHNRYHDVFSNLSIHNNAFCNHVKSIMENNSNIPPHLELGTT